MLKLIWRTITRTHEIPKVGAVYAFRSDDPFEGWNVTVTAVRQNNRGEWYVKYRMGKTTELSKRLGTFHYCYEEVLDDEGRSSEGMG